MIHVRIRRASGYECTLTLPDELLQDVLYRACREFSDPALTLAIPDRLPTPKRPYRMP